MIDHAQVLPQQKVLPYSEECEKAVLGAVLLEPTNFDELRAILLLEDFYVERHQVLWGAMCHLAEAGSPIDLRTIQALLEAGGQLDAVGLVYLATLDLDLPDIGRAAAYADIVRSTSVLRRAIQAASEGIRGMVTGGGSEALVRLQADLEALSGDGRGRASFRGGVQVADALLERIENPPARDNGGPRFGIPELDVLYGGIERGALALVGGRSGIGKSAAMCQMIANDLADGRRAAIVSLEMPAEELLARVWGHQLGLNWRRLWRGEQLTREHWRQLYALRQAHHQRPQLFFDDGTGMGLETIIAKLRALRRREGIDAAYIDFFTLIPRAGKRAAHEERDEQAYRLATFAKTPGQEISLVLLAQCNRGPAKENRPPMVADLRDAGEQPAKYVFLLHRDLLTSSDSTQAPVYGDEGMIILGKARGDSEGATPAHYDGRLQRWESLATWRNMNNGRPEVPPEAEQQQEELFNG